MQSINRFLYGPTPEERVRKWQAEMQKESRGLDREMRRIDLAITKAKGSVRELMKKGEKRNARELARGVVRARRQKDRLRTSQAQLNSIKMQLQHQLATLKITGTLQKSTEIMKLSNSLVKVPELTRTMQAMSQEMMKAGIMSEMVDDTMDMLDDDAEGLDEEADAEVDKVLQELAEGKLGAAGKVGTSLPQAPAPAEAVEEDDEAETERMQAQLDSLLRG